MIVYFMEIFYIRCKNYGGQVATVRVFMTLLRVTGVVFAISARILFLVSKVLGLLMQTFSFRYPSQEVVIRQIR